jgi:hypothetical protein
LEFKDKYFILLQAAELSFYHNIAVIIIYRTVLTVFFFDECITTQNVKNQSIETCNGWYAVAQVSKRQFFVCTNFNVMGPFIHLAGIQDGGERGWLPPPP